jgi:CheY-like chemotaxis protein
MTDNQKSQVLVVEDEAMVSMLIEDMVSDFGGEVVGPVARLDDALTLAREAKIDVAILDLNLAGVLTYPVARLLQERGIPFIFATGYGSSGLMADFQSSPTLQKPFGHNDLEQALSAELSCLDSRKSAEHQASSAVKLTA